MELPKILGGGRCNTGAYRCTETGGYYTVGNNAMYVQFKGVKGLVTVVLRKFFKIIAKKLVFNPFSNNSTFQEPLVCMLRYKFREAADLQGGATDLQGGANAPPPPPPPPKCGPDIITDSKGTSTESLPS